MKGPTDPTWPDHEVSDDDDGSDEERCERCGTEKEWTLDVNGVQRLECPWCD